MVKADSKKRMLEVYGRFNRIVASNSTLSSNKDSSAVSLAYGEPYALGTGTNANAAVAVTNEVILENTPTGTLDKVTIYNNRRYASPGDIGDWKTPFTTYISLEQILTTTPSAGANIYLGARGATADRDRHGIGIGIVIGFDVYNNSLNRDFRDHITALEGEVDSRDGVYEILTLWEDPQGVPWSYRATRLNVFRIDVGDTFYTQVVTCPSPVFEAASSSATSGFRVVYDVSDKGLTYSQPGRLIIEEVVSNLVEE